MRKYIVLFVFVVCSLSLSAQSQETDVQIGTILKIGSSESSTYKHIYFPKKNMIIKRGGIANYKKIKGLNVAVTSIEKQNDGTIIIKLKRKDGGRFFGSHTYVEANLNDALKSGELQSK